MGYCVDLIDELKEMMGFEYKIELVDVSAKYLMGKKITAIFF